MTPTRAMSIEVAISFPICPVAMRNGVILGIDVRGHRVVADAPKAMGGDGSGPTPVDLLAASLGACIGMYISRWCQQARVPYEGFEVEVDYVHDREAHCVSALTASIHMPKEFPDERREALLRVARGCTVHNTLCSLPKVEVSLIEAE